MGRAAVCVVPLRIGGGTRLKIFEAMAMGRAVVSTSIGAEGLPLVRGRHALIADGARGFADAVIELLRDDERRRTIGAAAHDCVVERYDWSVAAARLEDTLVRFSTVTRSDPQTALLSVTT